MAAFVSDRNLLFGILALQMDFITRDQLVAAMHAWVLDKAKPLGQVLGEQGVLRAERRQLLEALVGEHLKQHAGDPQQSLAALSSAGSAWRHLAKIDDPEVQASLASIGVRRAALPVLDDDADAFATISAPPGDSTGRFVILRPHASGGLGNVSVAMDQELHRQVALKQIKEQHAENTEARSRFLLEAEITGGLEHPGIVPVYSLGTYGDGRPYYAMRFIKGDSLKEAIHSFHNPRPTSPEPRGESSNPACPRPDYHSLAFRKLLGRFVDVCNAIAYAHSRGVLHRDLKPGNIMLGKYGETLVVDWGLAKVGGTPSEPEASATTTATHDLEPPLLPASGHSGSDTLPGSALGTPSYMSPEQAAGRLDQLGPASDVYSLGATLYHLLTVKAPFTGKDSAEILKRVQAGDFAPPRRERPTVPLPLEAVCLKAMSLKPADRYASTRELADEVERWLADEPVQAWPEPWTVKTRRWVGRHRLVVTGAAAALVVGILSLVAANLLLSQANRDLAAQEEQTQKALDREKIARNELAQTLATERRRAYLQAIALAERLWLVNNVAGAENVLDEATPTFRHWEWNYLKRLCRPEVHTLRGHTDWVAGIAFSPNNQLVASASLDGTARIWDVQTGQLRHTLRGHVGWVRCVAFSRDSKSLASGSGYFHMNASRTARGIFVPKDAKTVGEIKLWDVGTGKEIRTIASLPQSVSSLIFDDDGKRLLAGLGGWPVKPAEVHLFDASSGQTLWAVVGHGRGEQLAALSPDGRWLATGGADKTVQMWNWVEGRRAGAKQEQKPSGRMSGHTSAITALAFHPDNNLLASASRDGSVRIWDTRSGKEIAKVRAIDVGSTDGDAGVFSIGFHPDGNLIGCNGPDNMVKLWEVPSGHAGYALRGHTGDVLALAFSADGKWLASAGVDQTIRLWDASRPVEARTLPAGSDPILDLSFSPEGRLVASVTGVPFQVLARPTRARLWNVDTGAAGPPLPDETVGAVFDPDGKHLALAGADRRVRLWDAGLRQDTRTFEGQGPGAILRMQFSPDGRRLAALYGPPPDPKGLQGHDFRGEVRVWDTTTGNALFTVRERLFPLTQVSFSPDGSRIAVAHFSKEEDSKMPGVVNILEAATGREVHKLTAPMGVFSAFFHPKNQELALVSMDMGIHLWDLEAGKVVHTLRGHTNPVVAAAFHPDGQRLATGGLKTVRIWDTVTGEGILTLPSGNGRVLSLKFSPDGRRLAAALSNLADEKPHIRIWEAPLLPGKAGAAAELTQANGK